MTFRRAVSFACLGGFLILGAWVYVRAQSPRKPAAGRSPANADLPPSTFQPGPPTRFMHPTGSGTNVVPASASARPSLGPANARIVGLIPARVELTSGLILTGTLAAEPLNCQAAFGPASIPLGTIRGVRFHETESAAESASVEPAATPTRSMVPESPGFEHLPASPDGAFPSAPSFGTFPPSSTTPGTIPQSTSEKTPAGPAATIILTNGDSLTVALQAELLQLKTDWGVASIEVSHLRSIQLLEKSGAGEGTGEATHEWQQHDGRWQLVRLEDVTAEVLADDASKPADNIPALPQPTRPSYESSPAAPELPDLNPPASSTPAVQPPADDLPRLPPPQLPEPAELPKTEADTAPTFEPA